MPETILTSPAQLSDLQQEWPQIREQYKKAYRSNTHVTMGTVDCEGRPNLTPIGSLILKRDVSAFYFDIFASQLSKNLDNNPEVAVQFVNSGQLFWLKSLMAGKFAVPPAVRLFGTVSSRREATDLEVSRFEKRIGALRILKGYSLLWKNLKYVRDIHFHGFQPVNLGKMTR